MAVMDQILRRGSVLNQSLEQGVENRIVRQGVTVLLVRAQLGAGRFPSDRLPHQLSPFRQTQIEATGESCIAVQPGAERKDTGFVEVTDHGQASVHVSIEGAIPNSEF